MNQGLKIINNSAKRKVDIMSDTEKCMKLIEIASTEYMDKHHHYWSIYWRFSAMLAFVMGLYVFGENNINYYIQANPIVTAVMFILIIILIGIASFLVMCREHRYLLMINARLLDLYSKIKVEPFPENKLDSLSNLERFLGKQFSIATVLSISIIVISFLCIFLILLSSFAL